MTSIGVPINSLFVCAECERLQQDLLNVERLEGKVQAEMKSLKEKIQEMTEGLKTYRDLDALKASGEQKMKVADLYLYGTTVLGLLFFFYLLIGHL